MKSGTTMPSVSDTEFFHTANLLIEQCGRGEADGSAGWEGIVQAIRALQTADPERSDGVH